ncbi:transposase, partial [Rhodoflexus caldus]|uniref:transposase n=1 Tax=Rhodoflexus caldus TaxID=2891236 RepID=UPI00202A4874
LKSLCHKSAEGQNRRITVNHRLNELRAQARTLLNSPEGKAHRSKHPIEVEAVFGQLKRNNGFTRFSMRGLEKVRLEFLLMALGHNLRKMVAKARRFFYHFLALYRALRRLTTLFYKPCLPIKHNQTLLLAST